MRVRRHPYIETVPVFQHNLITIEAIYFCDVNSAFRRLKSLQLDSLFKQLVQNNSKENFKAPHWWPFVREIRRCPMHSPHKKIVMWKVYMYIYIRYYHDIVCSRGNWSTNVASVRSSWINHRLPHVSDDVCDITSHQITRTTGNTSSCCLLAVKDCQLHRRPYSKLRTNRSKTIMKTSWHGNNFLITGPLSGKFPGIFLVLSFDENKKF